MGGENPYKRYIQTEYEYLVYHSGNIYYYFTILLIISSFIVNFSCVQNNYDLQLVLDCNLGNNLSKKQRNDQLVKYKDT